MAINFTTIKKLSKRKAKIVVYGASGMGKTPLVGTLDDSVLVSLENGTRSLSAFPNLAVIEVGRPEDGVELSNAKKVEEFNTVLDMLLTEDRFNKFKTIAIDSMSEYIEWLFAHQMSLYKDRRQAYPAMLAEFREVGKRIRDCDKFNFVLLAKQGKYTDEDDQIERFFIESPYGRISNDVLYLFDNICRLAYNEEGEKVLYTKKTELSDCRDRSGVLDDEEGLNLQDIVNKLTESS